jgi:hypothetical protein
MDWLVVVALIATIVWGRLEAAHERYNYNSINGCGKRVEIAQDGL